ncbi:helix-turn-helix domain-containing protein [Bacillus sp. DJP31]|uniref:helix-turn-helix domain-containing protein n=1 Tax=Bacillus sp. DJP31 TaxID=3409789 RepID=UPI003BB4EE90
MRKRGFNSRCRNLGDGGWCLAPLIFCSDNVDRVYLSTLEKVCKVLDIDIQELIEVE